MESSKIMKRDELQNYPLIIWWANRNA